MNKFTWMIIALALAVAAGLLIKDTDNQPIIIEMLNYVRGPKTAEMMTGDVVVDPTAEVVATGTDTVVVDPTAEVVATGTDTAVVDPTAEVVATGTDTDTVVVEPTVEVVATGVAQ